MGYRRPIGRQQVTIRPEQYPGMRADLRAAPVGALLAIGQTITDDPAQMVQAMGPTIAHFADALISWNLEEPADAEDGPSVPVEPSFEALMEMDIEFVMTLVADWVKASVEAIQGGVPR